MDKVDVLIGIIDEELNVNRAVLKGNTRNRKLADARKIFSYILRKEGFGVVELAEILSKNHSVISFYCKNFHDGLQFDNDFKIKFDRVYRKYVERTNIVIKNLEAEEIINELLGKLNSFKSELEYLKAKI